MDRNYFIYIALFLTIAIGVGSLVSIQNVGKINVNNFDKIIHFGAYFMLSLSWFLALKKLKQITLISILVFVYGIIIEVLQATITSYRQGDYYDMIANLTGIIAAFIIFSIFFKKK